MPSRGPKDIGLQEWVNVGLMMVPFAQQGLEGRRSGMSCKLVVSVWVKWRSSDMWGD